MSMETIEKLKKAEDDGEKIIAEAKRAGEELIKAADAEAERIVEAAAENAKKIMSEAEERVKEYSSQLRAKLENEKESEFGGIVKNSAAAEKDIFKIITEELIV